MNVLTNLILVIILQYMSTKTMHIRAVSGVSFSVLQQIIAQETASQITEELLQKGSGEASVCMYVCVCVYIYIYIYIYIYMTFCGWEIHVVKHTSW